MPWVVQVGMMQQVETTIEDISQLLIGPIQSTLSLTQQRVTDSYVTLLQYVTRLNNLSTTDAEVNSYARGLQIWRKPLPNLELPQVRGFYS